ncbi:MAG TPA: ATP-binding cassette domain-containing protein [Egibacteraceae bacterium]
MSSTGLSSPAVRIRGLRKRFGATTALGGVDLDVAAGTVMALLGPNGAGKTTLVRILATLLRPDAGEVEVLGHRLPAAAAAVRREIALTGQYAAVDELLSGRENLVLFGRLLGLGRRAARRRADELLERFDLTAAADRPARTYSGGMRRRLDLASSLLVMPRLAFLDEPTTGLDPRSRSDIWAAVRELVDDGVTVLLTTQYLEEADALADAIAVIDHGRVVAEGTADELKDGLGGAVLEVRLRSAADRDAAQRALAPIGGARARPGEAAVLAVPVRGDGLDLVTQAAAALRRAAVEVAELGLRRPTLDEVFLTLTSRPGGVASDDGEVPAAAMAVTS